MLMATRSYGLGHPADFRLLWLAWYDRSAFLDIHSTVISPSEWYLPWCLWLRLSCRYFLKTRVQDQVIGARCFKVHVLHASRLLATAKPLKFILARAESCEPDRHNGVMFDLMPPIEMVAYA